MKLTAAGPEAEAGGRAEPSAVASVVAPPAVAVLLWLVFAVMAATAAGEDAVRELMGRALQEASAQQLLATSRVPMQAAGLGLAPSAGPPIPRGANGQCNAHRLTQGHCNDENRSCSEEDHWS